ncbi:unnamed protein product, partial [marine sediment metagenome]
RKWTRLNWAWFFRKSITEDLEAVSIRKEIKKDNPRTLAKNQIVK